METRRRCPVAFAGRIQYETRGQSSALIRTICKRRSFHQRRFAVRTAGIRLQPNPTSQAGKRATTVGHRVRCQPSPCLSLLLLFDIHRRCSGHTCRKPFSSRRRLLYSLRTSPMLSVDCGRLVCKPFKYHREYRKSRKSKAGNAS